MVTSTAEQLIHLIKNPDYWEIIGSWQQLWHLLFTWFIKKSHHKLVILMLNVLFKLSQTKVAI